MDKGTLWQLRNLIKRTAVPTEPDRNVKAAEDFLSIVLEGYIVVAYKSLPAEGMTSTSKFDVNITAWQIVDSFSTVDSIGSTKPTPGDDRVQCYSKEMMTLGLLWLGFVDAIREGDGDHVKRYWKFLMLLFKISSRRNYSCESAKLLLDYHYFLTPRQAAQLKWSRFINVHNREGCNIPADLHMEHLNRWIKQALARLGPNVTHRAIDRIGRAAGTVHSVCTLFEEQTLAKQASRQHRALSFRGDLQEIIACLTEANVFHNIAGKRHAAFAFNRTKIETVNLPRVNTWLIEQHAKYSKH